MRRLAAFVLFGACAAPRPPPPPPEPPKRPRLELGDAAHLHDGPVLELALAADGGTIAARSTEVLLFARDGRRVGRIGAGDQVVTALAALPEPGAFAAGDRQGRLTIWRGSNLAMSIPALDGPIDAVAVSADGRAIAVGGRSRRVRVFDARTLDPLEELSHPQLERGPGGVSALGFVSGGAALVAGTPLGVVLRFDRHTGAAIEPASVPGLDNLVRQLRVAPGGERVALLSTGGGVFVLGAKDLSVEVARPGAGATAIALDRSGQLFAARPDGVRRFDGTGFTMAEPAGALAGPIGVTIHDLAVGADGRFYAGTDVHRVAIGAPGLELPRPLGPVRALAEDRGEVVFADGGRRLGGFDRDGRGALRLEAAHRISAMAAVGGHLLSGGFDGDLVVATDGAPRSLHRLSREITALALAPDGTYVVGSSERELWIGALPGAPTRLALDVGVSALGFTGPRVVAVAGLDGTASEVDLDQRRTVCSVRLGERRLSAFATSRWRPEPPPPDADPPPPPPAFATLVAAAGRTVAWFGPGCAEVAQLTAPAEVTALALDGRRIALGLATGAIAVHAASGEALGQTPEHVGRVTALAFSADGGDLWSGGADGRVVRRPAPSR